MKIFVVFDEKGQIKGTVVSAHDHMNIRTPEGTSVQTIDEPEVGYKDAPSYVRDLHKNWRVEVLGQPQLVRKMQKKG